VQVRAPAVTITHHPQSPSAALAWARVWRWLLSEEDERHPVPAKVEDDAQRPATKSPGSHSIRRRRVRAKAAHS
jgi:hypothetical protein